MRRSNETLNRQTYSVDEVAHLLGIARTTAYESIHRGEIPARRFGRRIVVMRDAVDELLSASTTAGRPPTAVAGQLTFDDC